MYIKTFKTNLHYNLEYYYDVTNNNYDVTTGYVQKTGEFSERCATEVQRNDFNLSARNY